MHFFAMPWKVLFAVIPPKHYWGGWAAFIIGLAVIGFVTAIVGEFATILGCAINLKTSVTAITLVAMGTSLPDTFASKTAAQNSEYADAAVGNITGSNSVNVFLGLGLPWVIASVYYQSQDPPEMYKVPSKGLDLSVALFLVTAFFAVILMFVRRKCLRGELGGGFKGRLFSALLLVLL